jgi:hypothetical protein
MNRPRNFENGYQGTEAYPEYIEHFLYFPTQSDADEASKLLLARGWSVLIKPGPDGTDWLALATQPARGDEEMGRSGKNSPNSHRSFAATMMAMNGPLARRRT